MSDTRNVRSVPGTGNAVAGALANGTSVRNPGCRMQADARCSRIEMRTDMRERGRANARQLAGQAGQATRRPGASRIERARFPSGSASTELSDQLGTGTSVTCLLNARNGQALSFRLAAHGPAMSWRIFDPDGSPRDRGAASKAYRGQFFGPGITGSM